MARVFDLGAPSHCVEGVEVQRCLPLGM